MVSMVISAIQMLLILLKLGQTVWALTALLAGALSTPSGSSRHPPRQASTTSTVYNTRFTNVTWDNDKWQLATTSLAQGRYQSRMIVANGYHGINVAALGPFFEVDSPINGAVAINGWPLFDRRQTFATIGNFWDSQPRLNGTNYGWISQYGWDTAISGIPHWGGIILDLGNGEILAADTDNRTISNFVTMLDMKNGVMNWAFTWNTGQGALNITYQMFAHKVQVNQGFVNLTVTSQRAINMTVVNVLEGDCALRTQFTGKGLDNGFIFSAVQPNGVPNVTAYVYAGLSSNGAQATSNQTLWNPTYIGRNETSIASALNVSLQAGRIASFVKYVGLASSDGFSSSRDVARNSATQAMQTGYLSSLASHTSEWQTIFQRSFVDDFTYPENNSLPSNPYIIEAAIMAVTNSYYLLQNTLSENAVIAVGNASVNTHSIAVGGLGSESYAGQIFWDAEVWMQPGLVATFPYAAQGISNYRLKLHPQAKLNVQTAYVSSKNLTRFSNDSAIYPWTSGRFGNCTATGPCWDYQYHLNGDIVQAMTGQWQASGSEAFLQNSLYPVHQSISSLYSELLVPNGSYWALTNMTDPDEYANNVDNGAYTMALIAETLQNANVLRQRYSQSVNQTWDTQAQNVLIGKSETGDISLEYTGPDAMNGSVTVKQADVVLIPYPLAYMSENYTGSDVLADLDYYANKQSPDGPGMTYAIFSIVANEASLSGCSAYTYQQYSYQPYARAPWFQLSEQEIDDPTINGGTNPAFPFLTGHGGANQVVLFGYLGLRYISDGMLHIDPAPPQQIPNIRYRTFYWQGWPIQAVSNTTHTVIRRGSVVNPAPGTIPNTTFTSSPIPVMVGPQTGNQTIYSLSVNGSLVVKNRMYFLNKTVVGNVAQCQPVTSSDEFSPGQFPISAVDGASSTKWQPAFANRTASITVELPLGYKVTRLEFDWASQPPYNYSVTFHNETNSSSPGAQVVANATMVQISRPYNATNALVVQPVVGNTTTVQLMGVMSSSDSIAIYTARYATLSIWGNQYNSSFTVQNMTGSGATVAEWNIVIDSNGTNSSTISRHTRKNTQPSEFLQNLGRYNLGRRRAIG